MSQKFYFCDFSLIKINQVLFNGKCDKKRKIWIYNDYEIALDLVKNLGDFVEIEYIGKDKELDPKKITKEMISFLKKFGCGKIKRNYVGYPFQLLFPEEVRWEE